MHVLAVKVHLTLAKCGRRRSQVRGHNVADLDPLGIYAADLDSSEVPELLPHTYALGKARQPQRLLGRTPAPLEPLIACLHSFECGFLSVCVIRLPVRHCAEPDVVCTDCDCGNCNNCSFKITVDSIQQLH